MSDEITFTIYNDGQLTVSLSDLGLTETEWKQMQLSEREKAIEDWFRESKKILQNIEIHFDKNIDL